ncbi:glycine-rich domain-containing protein [Streptomyces sp. NPDC001633]|uniref:glycine-rich domain-containing protein n=1 Tax=Streptomyces sp. NPDC001633 TaxID=3364595 RepID=UPI00368DB7B7
MPPLFALERIGSSQEHAPSDPEGKDVMLTYDRPAQVFELITPEVRAELIATVREDWPDLSNELGERGVNQMVAFLATSVGADRPMAPSLRVDLFWHAFVLHTKPYADFCTALGNFVHHVPDRGGRNLADGRSALSRTRNTISAAGFVIDPEFWPGENAVDCSADCSQCHAGCSDSPVNK